MPTQPEDRWRRKASDGDYRLDPETAERVFRHNVAVMADQGATVRDIVLELSRKRDGDYWGAPIPAVQRRVEEAVRELGLKVADGLI